MKANHRVQVRSYFDHNMHLLELPPEILQQSLLYCTTPSFFHAIRSCKSIFRVAGSSRAVLLHHLEQVPGITLGLKCPKISNDDLFLTLRRRGAAHLFGLNLTADCVDFSVGHGTIDSNASWLAKDAFALALKNSLRVRLYDVDAGSCKLRRTSAEGLAILNGAGMILKVVVRHEKTYVLFSYAPCPSTGEACLWKSLQSDRQPIEEDLNDEQNALVESELNSLGLSDICYYVAVDEPASNRELLFHMPAPDAWLGRMLVPIDLAIDDSQHCAVLWDLAKSINPSIFAQVIRYTAAETPGSGAIAEYTGVRTWPPGDRPHEEKLKKVKRAGINSKLPHSLAVKTPPQPQSLPKSLVFAIRMSQVAKLPRSIGYAQNGRKIKLFGPGDIIPYHVASPTPRRSSEDDEALPDPFRPPANPWIRSLHGLTWNLTTSFYNHHVGHPEDANEEIDFDSMCTISYLSLATTNISWRRTERTRYSGETNILCVLRAIKTLSAFDCIHTPEKVVFTSTSYPNVKVVARLWGWQPSNSSLAGEQNIACCGNRIAIAEWDRVFIWSLDPKALIDEADDPAPVESHNSDQDSDTDSHVSVEQPEARETRREPAWTYPKVYDGTMEAWYVELKPIVLSASKSGNTGHVRKTCDTVLIRQIVWQNQNTLMVRTDKGLQIWNLGPSATGKRTQEVLEIDTPQEGECMKYEE